MSCQYALSLIFMFALIILVDSRIFYFFTVILGKVFYFFLLPLCDKARLKPSCINQTYPEKLHFEFGLIKVAFLSFG